MRYKTDRLKQFRKEREEHRKKVDNKIIETIIYSVKEKIKYLMTEKKKTKEELIEELFT